MYERFTDRARWVIASANQEAERFNHEIVGTCHILLGIVKAGSGVANEVLKSFGVDLRNARTEVERVVAPGPDIVTMHPLPHTRHAKKSIEFAIEEARNLSHHYVGTEHLLLGLLRTQDLVPLNVLRNLGVNPESVRNEVTRLLQSGRDHENGLPKSYPAQRIEQEMNWAIAEAKRLKHPRVGTEHLLLGIARKRWATLRYVLDRFGISLEQLRDAVAKAHPPGNEDSTDKELPHTRNMRKARDRAKEEAHRLDDNQIGSFHLLFGLLNSGENTARSVLKSLDVYPDALWVELCELKKACSGI